MSDKPQQEGVRLKVMWNGNPEGSEIWDLDRANRKQLVDSKRADCIYRDEPDQPAEETPLLEEVSVPLSEVVRETPAEKSPESVAIPSEAPTEPPATPGRRQKFVP